DGRGYSAVHLAMHCGHLAVVRKLVAAGARLSAIPDKPWPIYGEVDVNGLGVPSCLGLAALLGNEEMVRALLLGKGATTARKNGSTGLRFAATSVPGRPVGDKGGIIRALVDAGVDVNGTLIKGRTTPLSLACNQLASVGTLRALLQAKAEVQPIDSEGNTPLHFACGISHVN
ncbi:unnamed protein product, partial [Pylaiella littoralis]